jgi:DNA-binding GntR family transcriptional regulator
MAITVTNSATLPKRARKGGEVVSQALGDQVYELMKADIVLGRLAPGEEITELRLGERYGFGRAPVRGALSKLISEGLVTVAPRRGYVVAPITIKSVQEIFEMRLVCEPRAVRAAVGHVNVQRLKALNTYPGANDSGRQNLRFLKNNREFHMEIIVACGNQRLVRVLSGLYDEMDRLLHVALFSERDQNVMRVTHQAQGDEHDEIIASLERGDAESAEHATYKHIETSRDLALNAILNGRLSFSI